MAELQKISLTKNWLYRFASQSDDYLTVMAKDSDWLPTGFEAIPMTQMSSQDVLWLRTRFDLSPTEACVRYFLRSDGNIYPMTIYLRGQAIAQCDATLDIDITDYVSLDDNILVLAIRYDGQIINKAARDLYLQAIYCDDLD